jgi:hypothetical protein
MRAISVGQRKTSTKARLMLKILFLQHNMPMMWLPVDELPEEMQREIHREIYGSDQGDIDGLDLLQLLGD